MDFGVQVTHARYLTYSQTCLSVVILMIFIGTSFNSFMCYHVIIISYMFELTPRVELCSRVDLN